MRAILVALSLALIASLARLPLEAQKRIRLLQSLLV
jgi:hypothetical protein